MRPPARPLTLPQVAVLCVGMVLGAIVATHVLAQLMGAPVEAAEAVMGQVVGFAFALAVLLALVIQLLRR